MLLFLGAGASTPFGIPSMSGFLKLFDEKVGDSLLYKDIKSIFEKNCDLEVIMTIAEDLSKPKEELFRVISPQTAYFLLKMGEDANSYYGEKNRTEAKNLQDKIKYIIRQKCDEAVSNDNKIIDVYDDFFDLLERERSLFAQNIPNWGGEQIHEKKVIPVNLNVFTTNYDNCMEVYFNRNEIEFACGIVRKYGENLFDVDSYSSLQSQNAKVKIYKLHGSIDLFKFKGKIRQMSTAGAGKTFLGDERGDYLIRWPIEFGGYRNVIESPYLDMFRLLRDKAKDNWWIIIGFSFRDRTICSILNDLLVLEPKRERPHVLLVDMNPEPILKRLREWNYSALAEAFLPVAVEFGTKNLNEKIHATLESNRFLRR